MRRVLCVPCMPCVLCMPGRVATRMAPAWQREQLGQLGVVGPGGMEGMGGSPPPVWNRGDGER
jgi:hypothetical protein